MVTTTKTAKQLLAENRARRRREKAAAADSKPEPATPPKPPAIESPQPADDRFASVAVIIRQTELQSPDVDVCPRCRSRRYVEREFSDGRTDCVCKQCRATIDDAWPMSRQAAENRHARNYAEVFALAAESGDSAREVSIRKGIA